MSPADRLATIGCLGLAVAALVGVVGGRSRAIRGLVGLLVFLAVCVLVAAAVHGAQHGRH
jgi:hypothetical protein